MLAPASAPARWFISSYICWTFSDLSDHGAYCLSGTNSTDLLFELFVFYQLNVFPGLILVCLRHEDVLSG